MWKTVCWYVEPDCHTDLDWHRDIRRYVKRGCSVEIVDESLLEYCSYPGMNPLNKEEKDQLELF